MKRKKLTIIGIAVFAIAMVLNFGYALDDYGISTNKLTVNVLANSTSGGEIKLNGPKEHACTLYVYKRKDGQDLLYLSSKSDPVGYEYRGTDEGEYRTCVSSGDKCTTKSCRKSWNTTGNF